MPPLTGTSVLIAGAGLAGLAAAHDLVERGAQVTVVDARSRVGGRVWTVRDGFAEGQHAEAGGDMIDEDQDAIRDLVSAYGLRLARISWCAASSICSRTTSASRICRRSMSAARAFRPTSSSAPC